MKTLFKNFSILLIVLTIGATSCSRSDDSSPPPTPAELLANKWFLVKIENETITPPIVLIFDTCEQNGYYNFTDDGNLVTEFFNLNMSNVCESVEIQAFTYELNADGTTIFIPDGIFTNSIPIVSLSQNELILLLDGSSRLTFDRQP